MKIKKWAPKRIHVDYEKASINAILRFNNNVTIRGCYFHFANALKRKAYDLGLKVTFNQNRIMKNEYISLKYLCFIPVNSVEDVFKKLKTDSSFSQLDQFYEYFENYWIKQVKLSHWNYNNIDDYFLKTNNVCEGHNSSFSANISNNPKFFKVVGEIKKYFRLTTRQLKLNEREGPNFKKKPKYDMRILTILKEMNKELILTPKKKITEVCIIYLKRFVEYDATRKILKIFK